MVVVVLYGVDGGNDESVLYDIRIQIYYIGNPLFVDLEIPKQTNISLFPIA
jgi:hypothetical protein